MKKKIKKALPFWIGLLILGIAFLIVFSLLNFPSWITWLTTCLCWGGAAIWIGVVTLFGGSPKAKKSESFTGSRVVYERVSREIHEAITRYLESVTRRGMLKKSALYERPWFLVCGPESSGKTQLLSGSGLHFPLKYPSEKDGVVLDDGGGILWNFGNDAVWVDVPGKMIGDSGAEEWRAAVNVIRQVRPERAIDGVVAVVDAKRILDADIKSVKELSSSLRRQLDELIAIWGIEFPVYLVISKSDEIAGFNSLFRDPAGKWNEQILGATLSGSQQSHLPRYSFLEEYEHLCSSLKNIRLRMLAKEKNEERRRLICRFVIHFEGLQEKLANFVAELFKPSSYEGKPVFRGFYFTSCQSAEEGEPDEPKEQINVSQTIISHPLNPRRADVSETPTPGMIKRKHINSFFTSSLFKDVIPAGMSLVRKTQKMSRKEMVRYYSLAAGIAAITLIVGWYVFISAKNSISLNNQVKKEITQIKGRVSSRTEAYRMLGRMGSTVAKLKDIEDKGVPFSMGLGFYKGDRIFESLKKEYFTKVEKYIVAPSMKYLEYRIKHNTESFGELSGDDYNELYNFLKAYLSISEAVSGKLDLIDTASLGPALFECLKNTLLSSEKKSRLSENVETILQSNIGLYMSFLKNAEFDLVQENQHIVSKARKRLCRLPNAQALYKSVVSRLSPDAKQVTLDEMLDGAGILRSESTISLLYTQEGWDQYISSAIQDVSKDPYKIDWVLGTTKDQIPETDLDPKKLYQDMVDVYFNDVKDKWLLFVSSVEMEPLGDLERCGRILQKLGRDQSELMKFFEKVTELTQIKEGSSGEDIKVPKAVSKIAAKKTKKLKKLGVEPTSLLKRKRGDSFLADALGPFRSFVRSDKGALGGLEGYRDKILTLSEKLSSMKTMEGDNVVSVFNGKDTDPLFSAWTFTKNELAGMPDDIALSLEKLLISPIDYTANSVSNALKKQLNALWQKDVITIFTSRLAGRYPLLRKGDEALFDDVMDFFRPSTGIFWGFYDRRLSPFFVKSGSQWQVQKIGSVEVQFDPKLIETLKWAERIRKIFFQTDGTLRVHKVTMSPQAKNKNRGVLTIAESKHKIPTGGEGGKVKFTWPVEASAKKVSLKIYANENVAKEFKYTGQWGLMRMFEESRINIVNPRSFVSKWQVNVQNMYMIYFACKVKVAGSDHPFSERIFNGFDCPTNITVD